MYINNKYMSQMIEDLAEIEKDFDEENSSEINGLICAVYDLYQIVYPALVEGKRSFNVKKDFWTDKLGCPFDSIDKESNIRNANYAYREAQLLPYLLERAGFQVRVRNTYDIELIED